MAENKNTVTFTTDENEEVEFHIVEETKLNGITYLLVTDSDMDAEEGDAYLLKSASEDGEDMVYTMVEDDEELELIGNLFSELLEDIELEQ